MGSVNMRGQMLVVGLHALLGLSVLISASVLTALHDPISSELSVIFGAIIGLAGGGAAAISALGTAVNGKSTVTPQLLTGLTDTLDATVAHLADARRQVDAQRPLINLPPEPRQPPAG